MNWNYCNFLPNLFGRGYEALKMLSRIKLSDAALDTNFKQHTSFYLTSYATDMAYITHRRFSSTFINRSIDILLEFWRF